MSRRVNTRPKTSTALILKDYLAGSLSLTEIAERHSVSVATIHNIRNRAGVDKRRPDVQEQHRTRIVALYRSRVSPTEIAKEFGIHRTAVHAIVRQAGLKPHGKRKWSFNERFFQEKNEPTAYWMGFMMADGSLQKNPGSNNSWRLSLGLQHRDLAHLQEFCDVVGTARDAIQARQCRQRNPKTDKWYTTRKATVVLNDTRFADWLAPWGIVARKTYHFVPPNIPERLYTAYLRGWFDGDGCIYQRKKSSGFDATLVAYERKALEWYARALRTAGYDGQTRIYRTGGCWGLVIFRGKDILSLVDALGVRTGFCMKRKWEKVLKTPRNELLHFEATDDACRRIKSLYDSGKSTPKIAAEMGCASGTVYQCLVGLGVKIRGARMTAEQERKTIELHSVGKLQREIAEQLGVCQATVSDVLLRHHVKTRPRGASGWPEETVKKMKAAYLEVHSTIKVAEMFDASPAGVWKALKRAGVKMFFPTVPSRKKTKTDRT